ncbi:MAG: hypothetical protein MZV63_33570 [Marinilabiliales bacterium]|nr:hypothetical protein [Marinilabiliales bacterium]
MYFIRDWAIRRPREVMSAGAVVRGWGPGLDRRTTCCTLGADRSRANSVWRSLLRLLRISCGGTTGISGGNGPGI